MCFDIYANTIFLQLNYILKRTCLPLYFADLWKGGKNVALSEMSYRYNTIVKVPKTLLIYYPKEDISANLVLRFVNCCTLGPGFL